MPLADESSPVARLLEEFREQDLVRQPAVAEIGALRKEVVDPVLRRHPAGEETDPRRRTHRRGSRGVDHEQDRIRPTGPGSASRPRRCHTAGGPLSVIVGEEDQDIRWTSLDRDRPSSSDDPQPETPAASTLTPHIITNREHRYGGSVHAASERDGTQDLREKKKPPPGGGGDRVC